MLIVCKQTPKTANFMGCFGDESAAYLLRMGQHSTTDWLGHRISQSISIRTPESVGFQGDGLLFSHDPFPSLDDDAEWRAWSPRLSFQRD